MEVLVRVDRLERDRRRIGRAKEGQKGKPVSPSLRSRSRNRARPHSEREREVAEEDNRLRNKGDPRRHPFLPGEGRPTDCEVSDLDARCSMLDAPHQICTLCLDRPPSRMHGSRGCLGCCTKPTPIIAVDEPSKGLKIQGRTVKKPSISEDFWSTSTYEMENSGVQSQRSISSISTSTQNLDPHGGVGSTSNTPEFVNHGFLLWNQIRQQWIGNRRPENQAQQVKEPRLSWNATYDNLLGTNKPFPQPIPLTEMVDFLVDVWEQEGMYD